MSFIPYIKTPNTITVLIEGKTHSVSQDSPLFEAVCIAVKNEDLDSVSRLFNVKQCLADYSAGSIKLVNGELLYRDQPIHSALSERIVRSFNEGFDVGPMCKFLENLYRNPDPDAVDGLWGFLESCSLPITAEGKFVAYKMVGSDFLDLYTHKIDNSPGATVKVDRSEVEKNPEKVCSRGLHFASRHYVENGNYGSRTRGDRLIVVEIDPADVVSIPIDYKFAKGRCCGYLVLGEIEWETELPTGVVTTNCEESEEEEEYDDFDYSKTEEKYDDDEGSEDPEELNNSLGPNVDLDEPVTAPKNTPVLKKLFTNLRNLFK
jgi:hypothetical protein